MLVPVGAARGNRKALKPQENVPVFRKFSVIDWKPPHCTKQCVWTGRDILQPLILAAMSHGGWIMSPQDNQFRNNKFSSWQKEIFSSSTLSCVPCKGACLEWMWNYSLEHSLFSRSCSEQAGCPTLQGEVHRAPCPSGNGAGTSPNPPAISVDAWDAAGSASRGSEL